MSESEVFTNVFDVLELENAEEHKVVAELTVKAIRAIREQGLSDADAASLVGCSPKRIHQLHCADSDNFTINELCRYLVALGLDVRIAVGPPETNEAHLCVI